MPLREDGNHPICVIAICSMLPERSKDDDHIQGTAGATDYAVCFREEPRNARRYNGFVGSGWAQTLDSLQLF